MVVGTFVESVLATGQVLGAATGTYTVNLPTANYLQGLFLRVVNTNGSTSNNAHTIQGDITKLEVIGDGVTIFSMTGREARRWEHADEGDEPPMDENANGSAVQYALFPMKFGRHRQDKELILPAWKLSTLVLKITFAFVDSTTAGYTTSSSNAKFDLIGRYLYSSTQVNTPFLKKLEVYANTPSATGTVDALMPVGAGNGSYRRIMIRSYLAATEEGTIDTFQLRVNNSQILRDQLWDIAQNMNADKYKLHHTKAVSVYQKNSDTVATFVSRIQSVGSSPTSSSFHAVQVESYAGDTITLGLSDLATPSAVSTAEPIRLVIRGPVLSFCNIIDLGTDNIADSLFVGAGSQITQLDVRFHVATSGADTRIVTEQLVSY